MDTPVLDNTLKKEDFPTLGSPTIPIFRLFPGRPRRTFFSVGAAFFGGILILLQRVLETEKRRWCIPEAAVTEVQGYANRDREVK